ncbi:hypothetical protein J6TS2_39560 [Heyndrickxia sporothermodurans]|nr:hypothetical protein J6TS2_39560 [Heyndrickxia sporothermodurans]
MHKKYIRSALNYTGGKYKLLSQLFPLFPKKVNNFIDIFAGGGVVGINAAREYGIFAGEHSSFILNDIEPHVIKFFKFLKGANHKQFINDVEKTIERYGLSETSKYGYEHYGIDSSKGLGSVNKEAFLKLREAYNNGNIGSNEEQVLFYLLIVFGFNNQIRFNSAGKYNLPVGKRDFNASMKSKLEEFCEVISEYNFEFLNEDFRLVDNIKEGDFVYADPPYRITTATYNENGGWTREDDLDLFNYLNSVNAKNAKFALSNVVIHNNRENEELVKWMGKYNLHILNYNYNNSNYQSKARQSSTVEVLITNY